MAESPLDADRPISTTSAQVADVRGTVVSGGQRWHVAWYPLTPAASPPGTPHGAEGNCVTATGEIVLVSRGGRGWAFPAGRPEAGESWLDTLRREILEEACATTRAARLLGFTQGTCVDGPECGLVLVRSVWRADVDVLDWNPLHEIRYRRVIDQDGLSNLLNPDPNPFARFHRRAIREAGFSCSESCLDEDLTAESVEPF